MFVVGSQFKNLRPGLELPDAPLVVLTGPNNSGKSAILQWLNIHSPIAQQADYVSPRRFELSNQVAMALDSDTELQNLFQQRKQYNETIAELQAPDAVRELVHWNDRDRDRVVEWHNKYFGQLVIAKQNEQNKFSPPRITIDDRLATQQGSGSRAVLAVLVALFDPSHQAVLIDEPEIGIEPQVQRRLAALMRKVAKGEDGLPMKRVFIATHSHLFLDRDEVASNYIVTKGPDGFAAVRQAASQDDLHALVYHLLGNSPADLFFPDNILVVEGPSDQAFWRSVLSLGEGAGVAVHYADGDGSVGAALPAIEQMLKTQAYIPFWYRDRICVVVDASVDLGRMNEWREFLADDGTRVRRLAQNGIEFYYPRSVLRVITGLDGAELETGIAAFIAAIGAGARRALFGSFNGSKRELSVLVANMMTRDHLAELAPELTEILGAVKARSFSAEVARVPDRSLGEEPQVVDR